MCDGNCEIPTIAGLCSWSEPAERNCYQYGSVTGMYILIQRLEVACRWSDLESIFGMHSSKLNDIFWEVDDDERIARSVRS
eukprot:IDg8363t1